MSGTDSALLLRDFVNTYDVDCDVDELGAPSDLSGWLAERGLARPDARAAEADLAIAVALREGLRATLLRHQGSAETGPPAELERVLAALPLRVSLDGPGLVPVRGGVPGAIAALAAAITLSAADGDWARLKVCRDADCRRAFLDTSKNHSRTWCSMRMCGNRHKTRAYRARRRGAEAPGEGSSPGTGEDRDDG